MDWLQTAFAEAPLLPQSDERGLPAARLRAAAAEDGIAPATLHRAKAALGIEALKLGDHWYWTVPQTREETMHDPRGKPCLLCGK
jgi:hypothetical protein